MSAVCSAPVCDRPSKSHGLCGGHAERVRKGHAAALDTPVGEPIMRAAPAFDERYEVVDSGCWEWRGTIATSGYGIHGRHTYAHRVAKERETGAPIPPGMNIDHLCRNKSCVNPAHLEIVTPQVNTLRGFAARPSCDRGHTFTEDNIYRPPGKPMARWCLACYRDTRARLLSKNQRTKLLALAEDSTAKVNLRTRQALHRRGLIASPEDPTLTDAGWIEATR